MSNYQGPGRYRHYKGGEYEVIGLAIREETIGTESEVSEVVYRPLKKYDREQEFVTRLLGDFNAIVWPHEQEDFDVDVPVGPITYKPTKAVPRFQKL